MWDSYSARENSSATVDLPIRRAPFISSAVRPSLSRFQRSIRSYILRLNLLAAMLVRVSVPYKCRKLSEIEKCFCGFLPENAKCLTWNLSGNAQCEGGVYTNLAGTLLAGSGF